MMPEYGNVASQDHQNGKPPARPKLVALTVKLDDARYQKLKLYGLATRQSSQEILVQALDNFLNR